MTNAEYLNVVSRKALDGLIALWITMQDREHGGFGTIDAFGRKNFSSDRSAVMQSRTLYGLSAAYCATRDSQCAELAKWQYAHIRDIWLDQEYGGAWSATDRWGRPLGSEKAVYENAFMLYGLAEYILAFQDEEALELAKSIYYALEKARLLDGAAKGLAGDKTGYADCFSRNWGKAVKRSWGRQRSAAGEYGLDNQSHIIEAYANLYRTWPDAGLQTRLVELARLACGSLYCLRDKNVSPRYDENWQPLSKDESFGDNMELSWLISELTELTGNPQLREVGKITALSMTDSTLEKGLDREYGGIFDSVRGGKLEPRKMWWCQCEAINACLNAFSLTENEAYLDYAAQLWRFYEGHLIAPEGYWRGVVARNGTPIVPTGPRAMPICAYHSVRVCVKTIEATRKLIKKSEMTLLRE